MEEANIRLAKEEDRKEYAKIKKEDIKEYSKIIGENISINNKQIEKEFNGLLNSKDNLILIAEIKGKLIGYLTGTFIKNVWQHSGYIDDVFVEDNYKRKGIATRLIKEFFVHLKDKKIKKCRLGVNLKNKNAIDLYKKVGFEFYSYEMEKSL